VLRHEVSPGDKEGGEIPAGEKAHKRFKGQHQLRTPKAKCKRDKWAEGAGPKGFIRVPQGGREQRAHGNQMLFTVL